jgi:hypothetical protein
MKLILLTLLGLVAASPLTPVRDLLFDIIGGACLNSKLETPLSSKLTQGQRIAMTTTIAQNATWRTFANLSLVDRRKSVSLSIEDVRMGWVVEKRRGASVFEYNHQNPEGVHFFI